MSFLNKIPVVDKCCGCVTDLKTATAIIAVLGIVTSPVISWAMVRHAYVIRVSCVVSTNSSRPDVVDINFSNALSFGFGANAGLGPSCVSKHMSEESEESRKKADYVTFVRHSGWVVLIADIVFLGSSVNLLIKLFKGPEKKATLIFLIAGLVSIVFTFIYGILYVSACMYVGGGFPVFEFFFAIFDLIICLTWLYFLTVVNSFYHLHLQNVSSETWFSKLLKTLSTLFGYVTSLTTYCFGRKSPQS